MMTELSLPSKWELYRRYIFQWPYFSRVFWSRQTYNELKKACKEGRDDDIPELAKAFVVWEHHMMARVYAYVTHVIFLFGVGGAAVEIIL